MNTKTKCFSAPKDAKHNLREQQILSERKVIKYISSTVHSYPRVPRPAMGGLGGFCVGGLVLEIVPPRPAALLPCC